MAAKTFGEYLSGKPDPLAEVAAAGGVAAGGRVAILDPNGTLGTIAEEDLPAALAAGYKLQSAAGQHEQVLAQRHGDDTLGALAAGAARTATFGLTDLVQSATPEGREALDAQRRFNPGASLAGEIGGMLTGAGAAGLIGKAGASMGERVAGNTLVEGLAGGGLASRAVAKAAQYGAQAATEGALMGAQQTVTEVSLSHDPLNAEAIASALGSHMLYGGLAGAAAGGTLGGLGAVAKGAAQRLRNATTKWADREAALAAVPDDIAKLDAKAARAALGEEKAALRTAKDAEFKTLRAERDAELEALKTGQKVEREAAAKDALAFREEMRHAGDDLPGLLKKNGLEGGGLLKGQDGLFSAQKQFARIVDTIPERPLAGVSALRTLERSARNVTNAFDEAGIGGLPKPSAAVPTRRFGSKFEAQEWAKSSGFGTESGPEAGTVVMEYIQTPRMFKPSPTGEITDKIRELDGVIAASKLPEPLTVFRGLRGGPMIDAKVGDVVSHEGFMSTAAGPETARGFADRLAREGGHRVVVEIELPAGTPAKWISDYEGEILLGRGSRLEVTARGLPTLKASGAPALVNGAPIETIRARLVPETIADKAAAVRARLGTMADQAAALRSRLEAVAAAPTSAKLADLETKLAGFDRGSIASERMTALEGHLDNLANPTSGRQLLGVLGDKATGMGAGAALGMVGLGGGPLGALAGAGVGWGLGVLKKRMAATAGGWPKLISEGLDKAVSGAVVAAPTVARSVAIGASFGARAARSQSLESRAMDVLDAVGDMDATRSQVREGLAGIRAADPDLAQQIEDQALRRLDYLAKVAPKNPGMGGLAGGEDRWRPADADLAKFARAVATSEQPLRILDELASDTLTPQTVACVQAVYPEMFARLKVELLDKLVEPGRKPLSPARHLNLTMLTGTPTDSRLKPEFVLRQQQAWEQMRQEAEQARQQQKPPAPSQSRAAMGVTDLKPTASQTPI